MYFPKGVHDGGEDKGRASADRWAVRRAEPSDNLDSVGLSTGCLRHGSLSALLSALLSGCTLVCRQGRRPSFIALNTAQMLLICREAA